MKYNSLKKNIVAFGLLITSITVVDARRSRHQLDISGNVFGLNKYTVICMYDDVSKSVECKPIDPYAPDAFQTKYFPNVYVRKLTSDPRGVGYLGKYRSPDLNPGFISEYTSNIENFSVWVSKY